MAGTGRYLARREDMVLVLIDIQTRLAAAMERPDEVVGRSAGLARLAALVDAPIVVTRQYPKGLGGTVELLEDVLVPLAAKGGRLQGVDKLTFCSCGEPEFNKAMKATGRTQVVIAGMETHICVLQTALALLADGWDVHVVADACCSRRPTDHEVALGRLRSHGVTVTTTESVMYEVVGEAATEEFRELLAIVKEM